MSDQTKFLFFFSYSKFGNKGKYGNTGCACEMIKMNIYFSFTAQ